jgi:hypothetical protein
VAVNAVTGDPVPRAHVALQVFDGRKPRSYGAITTAEGKFSVIGLPGGNYNISADRLGFVSDRRSQTVLELKPGNHRNDVKLTLNPTGAVVGTVVDAEGEPVENCTVTAESNRGTETSVTDANGRFRIGGLAPGKYRIKAKPNEPQLPPEIRTDGTVEAHYAETYYPSALDAKGGSIVNVDPGGEGGGTEIRLVRTPIVRVSGKVTGIPQGTEHVFLMVQREDTNRRNMGWGFSMISNTGWSGGAQVKKDGTFALWRLSPGPYRIGVQTISVGGPAMSAAPAEVVVGDTNVDGLELRMMAAADLTGQVEYESEDAQPPLVSLDGTQPPGRVSSQLWLQGIDGTNGGSAARIDSNGAFTVEKVMPGRYHVMWQGGQGYVKSMRLGSAEIDGQILDLTAGAAGAALTVVISAQFGSISGTVQTDPQTAGLAVVLVAGGQGWMNFAEVGTGGSYSFDNVVPGEYKLTAISRSDLDTIQQDEDGLGTYAPVTETVTIRAGEKTTQDLKVLGR